MVPYHGETLMQLTTLFGDPRAVSPVIGVILMVAITVILAAVIGAFVLGFGGQLSNTAPQASFEFSYSEGPNGTNVTIVHGGGETFTASQIEIIGLAEPNGLEPGEQFRTGQTLVENKETNSDRIRVIWNNPSGGSSNVIGSSTVPR